MEESLFFRSRESTGTVEWDDTGLRICARCRSLVRSDVPRDRTGLQICARCRWFVRSDVAPNPSPPRKRPSVVSPTCPLCLPQRTDLFEPRCDGRDRVEIAVQRFDRLQSVARYTDHDLIIAAQR